MVLRLRPFSGAAVASLLVRSRSVPAGLGCLPSPRRAGASFGPGRSQETRMVGRTISHYKILEKVGEGGMGVVYKAEDLRLKRTVALKFLGRRAVHDGDLESRIVDEARAAAALDHPNICPVYEIDKQTEQIFIAMAFVDGQTVKDKLRSGLLELDEALDIAIQVARGLGAAHQKGITHRDIKSANIMVSANRRARILDFGLAIRGAADRDAAEATFAGTPQWMSPEQVRGEGLDHRTDIWSWGVLVYEMLAGHRPFRGSTTAKIVSAVLDAPPQPLTRINPAVPPQLERIVEKALAKRREDRYEDMDELLSELQPLIEQTTLDLPFPLALRESPGPSVAVLPFSDLSPGEDQGYLCDGIAEEIINALGHLEGLHVVSRTSAFAFRGRAEDIRSIGKKLGASTVLEGSVRRADARIRVTCQLINVEDGYHLWSERYDRALEDVFAIQEEIAQKVTHALEVELPEQEQQKLGRPATTDIKAYEYYLRGRQFFYRSKQQDIEYAIEMFSRAVAADSRYARALAGIAYCHAYLFSYFGADPRHLELAGEASRKALEIDPQLAEAHAARGLALSHAKRYRTGRTGVQDGDPAQSAPV